MKLNNFLMRCGILLRSENPRASIKFIKSLNKKNLVGVEIGTCEGWNARNILRNLDIKKLYLIDSYKNYEGLNDDNPDLDAARKNAEKILKKYDDKIQWLIGKSHDTRNFIPDELDFIYIDGNHSYEYVRQDLNDYFPKLKKGGVIAGHDIENGFCSEHDGVLKAVIEFFYKENIYNDNFKLYIHAPDFWMVKT